MRKTFGPPEAPPSRADSFVGMPGYQDRCGRLLLLTPFCCCPAWRCCMQDTVALPLFHSSSPQQPGFLLSAPSRPHPTQPLPPPAPSCRSYHSQDTHRSGLPVTMIMGGGAAMGGVHGPGSLAGSVIGRSNPPSVANFPLEGSTRGAAAAAAMLRSSVHAGPSAVSGQGCTAQHGMLHSTAGSAVLEGQPPHLRCLCACSSLAHWAPCCCRGQRACIHSGRLHAVHAIATCRTGSRRRRPAAWP